MATEEEEIQHLLELEKATEEYFRKAGYDIDLSEMSVQELDEFFLNLPEQVQIGLSDYVALETMSSMPPRDPFEIGMALTQYGTTDPFPYPTLDTGPTPSPGGMAVELAFTWPPLRALNYLRGFRVMRTPTKVIDEGLRWLGKALHLIDDSGDAVKLTARATRQYRTPAGRFGRDPRTTAGQVGGATVRPPTAVQGADGRWRTPAGRFMTDPNVSRTTAGGVGAGTRATGDLNVGTGVYPNLQRLVPGTPAGQAALGTAIVGGAFGAGEMLGEREFEEEQRPQNELDALAVLETEKGYSKLEAAQVLRDNPELATDPVALSGHQNQAENLAEQSRLLRQIYYKNISDEAAFDKVTNWAAGTGMQLAATGQSLYDALKSAATVLDENFSSQLYNLGNEEHFKEVKNYFMTNWENVPEISGRVGFSGGAGVPLEDAVEEYMASIRATSPWMLVMPNDAGAGRIGLITTFDGTMHGTIDSLNDLTSGGRIGPMNFLVRLQQARPEQLIRWQQELYAWGYLEHPPEVWGQLTPDASGIPPTLAAAQTWQVELFNVGTEMTNAGIDLSGDGTPRADRLMDVTLGRRASFVRDKTTSTQLLRQRVVNQAQQRVSDYLDNTGRMLPEGAIMQLQNGLQRELDKMNPSRYEEMFGEGGSVMERALAENLLKEFYGGTEEWPDMLMFGNGSKEEFWDYSQMVGAVSEEERALLMSGGTSRKEWGPPGTSDELRGVEKDVAVATMLKFVGDESGDKRFLDMTVNDLVNGLNVYMHTVGQSRGMTRNFSQRDLIEMATRALDNSQERFLERDTTLPGDIASGYMESEGIGGGVAGYKYREIVNELNRVDRSPGYLRTPNA